MKKTKFDKRLSAYADGALSGARRTRLERELERDPMLRETLERTQSLGRLVRDAWTDGPPAPPVDYLIASLRTQISEVDRERRARPAWQQALESARIELARWFGPVPIATSAAAAFLLALALLPRDPVIGLEAQLPTLAAPSAPAPSSSFAPAQSRTWSREDSLFAPAGFSDGAASIYDVSPTERPVMLFQGEDGSMLLWLLDDDGLSHWLESMDRWG